AAHDAPALGGAPPEILVDAGGEELRLGVDGLDGQQELGGGVGALLAELEEDGVGLEVPGLEAAVARVLSLDVAADELAAFDDDVGPLVVRSVELEAAVLGEEARPGVEAQA